MRSIKRRRWSRWARRAYRRIGRRDSESWSAGRDQPGPAARCGASNAGAGRAGQGGRIEELAEEIQKAGVPVVISPVRPRDAEHQTQALVALGKAGVSKNWPKRFRKLECRS